VVKELSQYVFVSESRNYKVNFTGTKSTHELLGTVISNEEAVKR
jgi:hypothetical protein